MNPKSMFNFSGHLEALSKEGDPLEVIQETVNLVYLREWLVGGPGYGEGVEVGRPPTHPMMMLKTMILQVLATSLIVSDIVRLDIELGLTEMSIVCDHFSDEAALSRIDFTPIVV